MWPTWQQSAVTGVICLAIGLILTLTKRRGAPVFFELTILAGLYMIWRVAGDLPLDTMKGAVARAHRVNDLERALHMPSELSLQHFALRQQWFGRFLNLYYATMHIVSGIAFLVWLFWRHRAKYHHWRSGLAICTAACLAIRYVRVAPPRLVPSLGYIDISTKFGMNVYGPYGTGVSDQLAAMPSIHVGWAAVVSFGIVCCSTSKWRWLFLLHVIFTVLAVSATGNHWWLDGLVAMGLLYVGLQADGALRSLRRRPVPAS